MIIRSWLFVPGDSERKLEKGRENPADALILDLEDAVSNDRQQIARDMVQAYLKANADRARQQLWVRINPLDTELSLPDLAAVMLGAPDGIVLPKVYSAADVNTLGHYLSALEAREGLALGSTRICCVATETAASLLSFHTYLEGVTDRMVATPRYWIRRNTSATRWGPRAGRARCGSSVRDQQATSAQECDSCA